MHNIIRKHHKGIISIELSTTFLWTILLVLSLSVAAVFIMTLLDIIDENSMKSSLQSTRKNIVSQVSNNFNAINTQVKGAIQSALSSDGASDEKIMETLKNNLPNATRIMISSENPDDIIPESFPGINYATLDMLKKASVLEQDPTAEIHLYGQKDQYLNYIHAIDKSKFKYLIISMSPDKLLQGLQPKNLSGGYITLNQEFGKFSKVRLKSWGNMITSGTSINNSDKIANSYFSVDSSFLQPDYLLKGMTVTSAIAGILSSLLLFAATLINILKKLKEIKNQPTATTTPVYVPKESKKIDENTESTTSSDQNNNNMDNFEMTPTNTIEKSIFRAYDIRGIVDEALTVDAVRLIGQAIGTENIKRGKQSIVVARDGRLSGKKLLEALVEGLLKSGCNVINIGAVPTGVLYFATHHLETGSGVMLTGSHNPPNYNGLKIMLNGETLAGELIQDLYYSIINNELANGSATEQKMDIADDYIDYISSDIQLENELKVVVDCGNGIGGDIGPEVLEEIGCDVIPLYCEIDGSFPNHHPDPSVPKNLEDLITTVKAQDADLGIAFDGDADRLGVVTKQGEIIYPDRLLMLFAKDVLIRQPGASIIFDVKCTGHLPKEIVNNGGLPIIWKTGHSFMKAKIKETNAALAGEMSGHFFFNERWFGFDDGIYAAARLLEILDQENRPAQEVFDELPDSVSTPELKCHTEEGENYAFMEKFQKTAKFPDAHLTTIDGIRADFADGWGLVRCSNTTPCLVLRFDADNQQALERIQDEFREQILAVDDSLNLPF